MNASNDVRIARELATSYEDVFQLYKELEWDSLGLTVDELQKMCQQSLHVLYAYQGDKLVGMGRIVSDGVITGLICGVGVLPSHQNLGIGRLLMTKLIEQCDQHRIIPQLMCDEKLEPYYETVGFRKFAVGMTRERKYEAKLPET